MRPRVGWGLWTSTPKTGATLEQNDLDLHEPWPPLTLWKALE